MRGQTQAVHCGNMGADMDIALWIRVSMGWKETASRVNNLRWLAPVKTVHTGPAVVVVVSSKWTATQHYPPQPQLCTLSPSKNVSQHPELRSHPGTRLASVLSVVWGQPRASLPCILPSIMLLSVEAVQNSFSSPCSVPTVLLKMCLLSNGEMSLASCHC